MAAIAPGLSLDSEIIAVLTELCSIERAEAVLASAEAAFRDGAAEADAADVASLNPLIGDGEAASLKQAAEAKRFEVDRLDARVSALRSRVADLEEAEAVRVEELKLQAVLMRRDTLAADIARDYPRLVGEITRLAKRIHESDAECAGLHVHESAEALGRSLPMNFYDASGQPLMRIGDMRLPMPDGVWPAWHFQEHALIWPGAELGTPGAAL